MSDVYTGILIVAALVALLAVISGAIVVTRSGIVEKTNTMLDRALEQTRRELIESEARCKDDLFELASKHDRDMAGLRGRIDAMTPAFADLLAEALAKRGKQITDA